MCCIRTVRWRRCSELVTSGFELYRAFASIRLDMYRYCLVFLGGRRIALVFRKGGSVYAGSVG